MKVKSSAVFLNLMLLAALVLGACSSPAPTEAPVATEVSSATEAPAVTEAPVAVEVPAGTIPFPAEIAGGRPVEISVLASQQRPILPVLQTGMRQLPVSRPSIPM